MPVWSTKWEWDSRILFPALATALLNKGVTPTGVHNVDKLAEDWILQHGGEDPNVLRGHSLIQHHFEKRNTVDVLRFRQSRWAQVIQDMLCGSKDDPYIKPDAVWKSTLWVPGY